MRRIVTLIIIALLFQPVTTAAEVDLSGWENKKGLLKEGAIVCASVGHMKMIYSAIQTQDADSMFALIEKGVCLNMEREMEVTVVTDASEVTDPPMVKIMHNGNTMWTLMAFMWCCEK